MAAAATFRELKNMCRALQPPILFVMETRAPGERIIRAKRKLKFQHVFWVEPRGLSGGWVYFGKTMLMLILSSHPSM